MLATPSASWGPSDVRCDIGGGSFFFFVLSIHFIFFCKDGMGLLYWTEELFPDDVIRLGNPLLRSTILPFFLRRPESALTMGVNGDGARLSQQKYTLGSVCMLSLDLVDTYPPDGFGCNPFNMVHSWNNACSGVIFSTPGVVSVKSGRSACSCTVGVWWARLCALRLTPS